MLVRTFPRTKKKKKTTTLPTVIRLDGSPPLTTCCSPLHISQTTVLWAFDKTLNLERWHGDRKYKSSKTPSSEFHFGKSQFREENKQTKTKPTAVPLSHTRKERDLSSAFYHFRRCWAKTHVRTLKNNTKGCCAVWGCSSSPMLKALIR